MQEISIVVASDDQYAQHGAVTCASILVNHKGRQPVHFYYLSDNITESKAAAIAATVNGLNGKITFILVGNRTVNAFTSGHVSKAAYLRLLIPELLPIDCQKAIYFDTDLVVLDDVQQLWEYPLNSNPVGAVPDLGILSSRRMQRQKAETIGVQPGELYFNSGVMVMDMAAWRRENYSQQVIACVEKVNFRHHDQDGLNKVFHRNWQPLPLRWNVIPPVFTLPLKILRNTTWRAVAIEAAKNPAVMHWAGRYKPWEFPPSGAFNQLYYDYLEKTTFADAPMPQPSREMQRKSILRQQLRMQWAGMWKKLAVEKVR